MLKRLGIACLLMGLASPALADEARPVRLKAFLLDDQVAEDGTVVQTLHMETAVGNEAAARREAQQGFPFSEAVERLEVVEAYTLKPNGTRVKVEPGAVRVQLAPGVENSPEYSDRKRMVAVFPEVAGGDVLVATWRRTVVHPAFPGQFHFASTFTRTVPWDDAEVTVTTPADKPLQTETHGPTLEETVLADGRHFYHWHYAAPDALAEDPAAVSPLQRAPRIFGSTFKDWPAFSRGYAALLEPQATVTPKIQALADEVTAGVTDKREQARLLYEWVSHHVRWVAIYLGNDNWIPHAAEAVLANGYGDCKDQATLLIALLRAKGLAAEAVLINIAPVYEVTGPAVGAFDHCITYLPDWGLYADTTSGGAPFGTVPLNEYGKPVLHIRADGAEVERLPPVAPGMAAVTLRTMATLGADGSVSGTTVNRGVGPYAAALMIVKHGIAGQGREQVAARDLRSHGEPGEGRYDALTGEETGATLQLGGRFTLEKQPGWLEGDAFQVPTGLRALARTGDLLIGPLGTRNLPATEPTPCHAGRSEEELSLALPPGYQPERLPQGKTIEGTFFRYESRFGFDGGVVTVHRSLVSTFAGAYCAGAERAEAAKALVAIRRDVSQRLSLERKAAP